MTVTLNPYLTFADDAREAMTFYQSVFGGELSIMTFAEMGMTGEGSDLVMHANLVSPEGLTLMCSDAPPGSPGPVDAGGSGVIALSGDETERLRGWFHALGEGGEVSTPLAPQAWGDEYGDLTDRFGVRWLANIAVPAGA